MTLDLLFKLLLIVGFIAVLFALIIGVEIALARSGPRENFINPSREYVYFGEKPSQLTYLIMGESTTAGQGGTYEKGIAYKTAEYLAKKQSIKMINTSVSGATMGKLIEDQLESGLATKPDIVLLSIGGNDVTNLTDLTKLETQLEFVLDALIKQNCNVKIIVTGSPDMGSLPRLMQPLRSVVGLQTIRVNKVFDTVIAKYDLTHAPIARETGPVFRQDHTLFAEDKFHPNDKGYELWIKVINIALDKALSSQQTHCKKI